MNRIYPKLHSKDVFHVKINKKKKTKWKIDFSHQKLIFWMIVVRKKSLNRLKLTGKCTRDVRERFIVRKKRKQFPKKECRCCFCCLARHVLGNGQNIFFSFAPKISFFFRCKTTNDDYHWKMNKYGRLPITNEGKLWKNIGNLSKKKKIPIDLTNVDNYYFTFFEMTRKYFCESIKF